ncbi:MAG: sulfurase [Gammaproteobacteria bacterium]|nr:MOSC domain-containing protein [Gammaproteobacteria bacterium]PCH64629.1 MAG: sulfurase [Gammaproteobacteria bacterium]
MTSQARLFGRYIQDLPTGKLEWIGLRPARNEPMQQVTQANAIPNLGLEGDRRCNATPGSARQITLISAEHITLVASLLKRDNIDPALLRRNLVISGLNLHALRHQRFRIGEAEFEATAQCHPCSRMDAALGKGGCAAMLGHGGLCAKILVGGQIKIGDDFIPLEQPN